jgi:hypothetical protein
MRPRLAALALLAVVLVAAAALFAIGVVGCGPDVDRDSYVAKNLALLNTVPAFPGARLVTVDSAPYRLTELPGAGIAGYGTVRAYRLPAGTKARAVISFYRRALQPEWEFVAGSPDRYVSLHRGDAYLHILPGAGNVAVEIDHDCYKLLGTMGCFGP